MGGRGASSGGRGTNGGRGRERAPTGYRTAGKVGGIRIIRNSKTGKGLPIKTHTPNAKYFGTNSAGKVDQLRIYDKNGKVKKDYDWNHNFKENGKSYPSGTVHSHQWKGGTRSATHQILTPAEKSSLKPKIEKATGNNNLQWD